MTEEIELVEETRRSKTLSEKIRDLGIKPPRRRTSTSQIIDIKTGYNQSSDYTVITPNLNLEQITYFQPEVSYDESEPEKCFYKINQSKGFESLDSITRIADIPVKSYRPSKKMKFRAKKRSSMISQIEQILDRYKESGLSREPSEESIERYVPMGSIGINDLPESVLQKVFLNFTLQERNLLLSRVCKSWYYMLKDPIFWSELEFCGDTVNEETVFSLMRRYPNAKKISLISVPSTVNILQELCRINQGITHLAVKYCDVTPTDFSRVIHRVISCCTDLEVLDLKGMTFRSEGFYLDLGRLRNLRSISLTGNKMLRNRDLITLSVNCKSLVELKILDISLDGEGSPLRDEDLSFIFLNLQAKLQTLKLDMKQLRNASYQAILKCSNLTTLTLTNCFYLSRNVFRQFPVLHKLRRLKFTRAINIKSDDFQFVFAKGNLKKIEVLDINGCWGVGEDGLRAITQGLTHLKYLSLKTCKSIKGSHLSHLVKCPELTDLNLAHTAVESHQLPSLYQYVRGLASLVIDVGMYKQSVVKQLKRFYPSLKIIISYSEFQKDERLLGSK